MAEKEKFLLKNMYSPKLFDEFTDVLNEVLPTFDKEEFLKRIFTEDWEELELKQRMHHTTLVLHDFLPNDLSKTVKYILEIIDKVKDRDIENAGFAFIVFPDYIETYGLDDFETSINAFEEITQFVSAEFAVRPFIKKYPKKMMQQMLAWSGHLHEGVRRLSSEGCRPRLPWAMALPTLKKDPSPILPIFENLKNDPSETVRRSVANNLNDISKDNPDVVLNLAKKWKGQSKETDRIIKHACRTMLKKGTPEALELFDYSSVNGVEIKNFTLESDKVEIGNNLNFSFELCNTSSEEKKLRLEYRIYYMKANGQLAGKVFKLAEQIYPPNSETLIKRKRNFKRMTTRKLYPGEHQIALILNGREIKKCLKFEVS
ncbi:MAG: DNA alkylation repair protein [Bacteroidetes bacterium]|nr:DNA alkylation repair protein [Bacteroidota bacterium]